MVMYFFVLTLNTMSKIYIILHYHSSLILILPLLESPYPPFRLCIYLWLLHDFESLHVAIHKFTFPHVRKYFVIFWLLLIFGTLLQMIHLYSFSPIWSSLMFYKSFLTLSSSHLAPYSFLIIDDTPMVTYWSGASHGAVLLLFHTFLF